MGLLWTSGEHVTIVGHQYFILGKRPCFPLFGTRVSEIDILVIAG